MVEAMDAAAEAARVEEERVSNLRYARLLFLGIPLALLLWWPADELLFGPVARARLSHARLELAAISLVTAGLLFALPVGRRYPRTTIAPLAALLVVRFGQLAGELGGPTAPWWQVFHLAPLATAAIRCSLPTRISATLAIVVLAVAAFLLAEPVHTGDPASGLLVSTLLFACLVSIFIGHVAQRLWTETFTLKRALREEASLLEDRVREQTAELHALTAGIQTAREAERKHIARELHDDLGQQLTGLEYALTLVDARFARDPASVAPNLRELRRQLDRTQQTMRRILLDLRPPVLDELGLVAAAESLVAQIGEQSRLSVRLQAPENLPDLPEELAAALYRILQESLNNVVRHASATRVDIVLDTDGAFLSLKVADDGVGLRAPRPIGGFGLMGMRERAQAFGGSVTLESGGTGGVTLTVRIPLPAGRERASA